MTTSIIHSMSKIKYIDVEQEGVYVTLSVGYSFSRTSHQDFKLFNTILDCHKARIFKCSCEYCRKVVNPAHRIEQRSSL